MVLLCPGDDSGIVRPVMSTVPEMWPRAILLGHAAGLFLKVFISKFTDDNAVTSIPSSPQWTGQHIRVFGFPKF